MTSYVCFEVYYKHGEFSVETRDEENMREYCFEEFDKFLEENEDSDENEDIVPSNFRERNFSTDHLCEILISIGKYYLSNQIGYGVVSIVKGKNLNVIN